ncbi:uncharacterized protein K02A2.6 [Manduca sexta]|uniref:uncharacterized protein K02A2.6 n=1 Tax=Manduca sexta TaxID=7130 RepID=UPI00188E1323|nr:uncharacterized protein K02A2.6 [Manduca sexta]
MAASRMQRWAVILAGYDYSIEYVRSDKNAADALSRLPVEMEKHTNEEFTYLNFVQKFLPITRQMVQDGIDKDEDLKKVVNFIQAGWPNVCKDELKAYFVRRNELYMDRGCIVWGYRLVIPMKLRERLLSELHLGHLGIVKMKSIARGIVWWPGIDLDIENTCKQCTTCCLEGAAPPKAVPQPWPYIAEPWSRLYIDFLGLFQGKTFLVMVDCSSKWLEVFLMPKTNAQIVIKVLRTTFARFGLPKEIVSDNGPPFTSREYLDFMENNGIKVTFTPAYHPSSNGAAENAVKLCKRAIRKSLRDGIDIDTALQTYLMMYRNVEHSTTGIAPAMLLQRRRLRTRLDLLRVDRQLEAKVQDTQRKQVCNAGGTVRDFKIGDPVWARDFTGGKWLDGTVKEKLGSRNYNIGRESGPFLKRHVDQIKKRRSSYTVSATEPFIPSLNKELENPMPLANEEINGVEQSVAHDATESGVRESETVQDIIENPTVENQRELKYDENPVALPVNRSRRIRKPVRRYGFEDYTD